MAFGFAITPLIGSGVITSGDLGRNAVGWPHMASGAVQSGVLSVTGTPNGTKFLRDDFSWQPLSVISGGFGSGGVVSGAVQGFFGTTLNIASGTVGRFDLGSGAVVAGSVGSGAIVSGNVASGQIGGDSHMADNAVQSGTIASGQVGRFHVASGAINSGAMGSGSVLGAAAAGARNIASGTVGPNDIGSGAILSGVVASGQLSRFKIASGAINSGAIASGQISQFHLSSGVVGSGNIGDGAVLGGLVIGDSVGILSGSIGATNFGSGAITSGDISSGQVGGFHIASGSVTSGRIGVTGTPDGTQFLQRDFTWASVLIVASGSQGSGVVQSGNIASGQIGTNHLASGDIVTFTRSVIMDQYKTTEAISGVRCVALDLTSSGAVRIAMAAVSGRMPAVGVAFGNALSGQPITVVRGGTVTGPSSEMGSGLCISGRMARSLWVGASGQVVTLSGGGPTIGIGATNSGAYGQRIGTSAASGSVLIDIDYSGLLSGAANITTNFQQWPI